MQEKALPSLKYSLITLFTVTIIIVLGLIVFDASLQMMMFISFVTSIPFAIKIGYSYKEVEDFAFDMIRQVLQPAMILLAVGALIGAWILSGTVPTLIYGGLAIITPSYFLVTALALCVIVSLATGTSWGTIGTAGLAMMGIGSGLGIPPGITAGAIISGAYFGDKMSPLSDSTNLAPAISGGELFSHIKHMMWTTVPAIILSAIVFLFIGFRYSDNSVDTDQISMITNSLSEIFTIGWVSMIPAVVVLVLLLMRKPAFTSIFVGALVGGLVAVLHQGSSVSDALTALYSGVSIDSGRVFIDELLNRGGVMSMFNIVALFLFALGLGGILSGSGILTSILQAFSSRIKSARGLIFSTAIVSYVTNMVGGTISFAAVMTGTLMKPLYKKFKLRPENLSRVIEDVGTLGGPIIPWNTGALFSAAALSVSPLEFIPFVFLSFFTLIITLIYGATGFTITTYDDDDIPEGFIDVNTNTSKTE